MKKLFLTIVLVLFWFINFSNAWNLSSSFQITTLAKNSSSSFSFWDKNWVCLLIDSAITNHWVKVNIWWVNYNIPSTNWVWDWVYCWSGSWNFTVSNTVSATRPLLVFHFNYNCPVCDVCQSQYTSLECQQEYNLIPLLSVDENYCVDNWLCPVNDCPVWTWYWNWSALYINNIQHLSAPIINVDIPEEFDWDYSNDSGEFNLDIKGYNVDTDYIAWIITTQNSKPTNEDLNNIITNVIPLFVPWLVIILFIYFVFRFLKKIF